jgi:hypothetical protein
MLNLAAPTPLSELQFRDVYTACKYLALPLLDAQNYNLPRVTVRLKLSTSHSRKFV